jgi:hypothetical protein
LSYILFYHYYDFFSNTLFILIAEYYLWNQTNKFRNAQINNSKEQCHDNHSRKHSDCIFSKFLTLRPAYFFHFTYDAAEKLSNALHVRNLQPSMNASISPNSSKSLFGFFMKCMSIASFAMFLYFETFRFRCASALRRIVS